MLDNDTSKTPDVIYIKEMAEKLGKSVAAVRLLVYRDRHRTPEKRHLPEPVKIGGRIAWRRTDADKWLAEKGSIYS